MRRDWLVGCAVLALVVSCGESKDKAPRDAGSDAALAHDERADAGGGSGMAGRGGAGASAGAGAGGKRAQQDGAGQGGKGGQGEQGSAAKGGGDSAGKSAAGGGGQAAVTDAGTGHDEDAGADGPGCRTRVAVRASGTATVWLVIDASGSMVDVFGSTTRWDALRDALLNPSTGLVKALQGELQWGLMLYDGPLGGGGGAQPLPDGGVIEFPAGPATTCPRTQLVEPQLNNFAALDAAFPSLPLGGSTPTDKALLQLSMRYAAGSGDGPVSIVLATDGAPNDFCSMSFTPPDVRPYVVQTVRQLFASGIATYTLSLAADDQMLMQHLTEVAAAGGTGKPVFTPADTASLTSTLREIVGKETGCSVRLSERVPLARACDGSVELAGQALRCNDPNGFSLHDDVTLQLSGDACERFRSAGVDKLEIDYPCSSVLH